MRRPSGRGRLLAGVRVRLGRHRAALAAAAGPRLGPVRRRPTWALGRRPGRGGPDGAVRPAVLGGRLVRRPRPPGPPGPGDDGAAAGVPVAAAVALAGDQVGLGVLAAALAVTAGTPTYPAIAASLPRLAGAEPGPRHRGAGHHRGLGLGGRAGAGRAAAGQSLRPWTLAVAVALAALGLLLPPGSRSRARWRRRPTRWPGCCARCCAAVPPLGALGVAGLLNLVVTVTGVVLLPLSQDAWGPATPGSGWPPPAWVSARSARRCWRGWSQSAAPRCPRPDHAGGAVALVAVDAGAVAGAAAARPGRRPGVVIESLVTGTLQDAVPDRYRAGALGLADTIMVGACLVGSLVAPALARYAGARPALLLVASPPCCRARGVGCSCRRPRTAYDAASERTASATRSARRTGSGCGTGGVTPRTGWSW